MVEKITPVPLREVWVHEAIDFTPWLLDNLDFLNDVLPFDLIEAGARRRQVRHGWMWLQKTQTEELLSLKTNLELVTTTT